MRPSEGEPAEKLVCTESSAGKSQERLPSSGYGLSTRGADNQGRTMTGERRGGRISCRRC
eukprot:6181325-Pleurochrysis_carterae.AAC.2